MKVRLGNTDIGLAQYLGLWTVVAVVFGAQALLRDIVSNQHVWSLWDYIRWGMIQWYTWAALAPWVFRLAEKYPIRAPLRLRGLGRQLPLSLGMTMLSMVIGAIVSTPFEPSDFTQQLWYFVGQH